MQDHLSGVLDGLLGSFLPQTQQLEAMFSAILILRLIVGYDSKSSFVAQLDGRTCLDYIDNPMRPMGCVVWLYSNFQRCNSFSSAWRANRGK